MRTVVPAAGIDLGRIVSSLPSIAYHGLTREAFAKFDTAQARTTWGLRHRRRLALADGDDLLASAERFDLAGVLDDQPVAICGIAAVFNHGHRPVHDHRRALIERLIEDAQENGADLALLFETANTTSPLPDGFEVLPTTDVELVVVESSRHGAPMTLVRGGEDRDLEAIAAMGQVRAHQFPFHLDRGVDFVKYAITRKRLLAGLGSDGIRQLQFVIAEEGITAAAYIVMSVADGTWTIEECGDRDPSGARVGALLQALIAREPAARRPAIRGWLPAGFVPPQVTIASARPSTEVLMVRALSPRVQRLRLSSTDLLYWRNDLF